MMKFGPRAKKVELVALDEGEVSDDDAEKEGGVRVSHSTNSLMEKGDTCK